MLRHEDNMALTQVGPGTPMGRFMRRYWLPAAKLEQIGEAGGAPARVKLLGESLVAFRDPAGKPGLIGEFCPHRGASLAYGRNEEGGLRCLYHGWKMGCSGYVLEFASRTAGPDVCQETRARLLSGPRGRWSALDLYGAERA